MPLSTRPLRLAVLTASVVTSLLAAGCHSASDDTPPPAPSAAPSASASASAAAPDQAAPSASAEAVAADAAKPLRGRPQTQAELPTTDARIHKGNIDGMIDDAEKRYAKYKVDLPACRSMSSLSASIGKIHGDLDMIQRGIDAATKCLTLDPKDGPSYVNRANAEQSLHKFVEAQADLDKAKTFHGDAAAITGLQTELDWNAGRYDTAIPAIRAARKAKETPMSVAREAQLAHDLGQMHEADVLFEQAEDLIRDTSPVPVAWLYQTRGIHLVACGRLDEAITFFRAAVDRFPTIADREHLAETLHMAGKDDEATTLYTAIVKDSTDPEFEGALAAIDRAHGQTKEADALKAKATAGYDALLVKFPEDMYWHASEYFLGEGGDAKRAEKLLEKNLKLRPNSVSLVALARAKLANGDAAGARADVEKALKMPLVSALLYWTAARAYAQTADLPKSADYASKAKALNPLIDTAEPKLR